MVSENLSSSQPDISASSGFNVTHQILESTKFLLEHSPDGIHVINTAGDLIYANPAFYRMLGYAPEEGTPRHVKEWDLQWSVEELPQVISDFVETNRVFITQHRRKDGSVYEAEINLSTLFHDEHSFLLCSARDVTPQRQLATALRESEARFRKIFYEDKAIKVLINPQTGEIVDADRAALSFYGYSYEQITHMKIQEINQLPPDEVAKEMQNAVEKRRNYFNFKHRLASGEIRDVEVYSTALEIDHAPYLFSIIHDVTERVRAEKALQESEKHHREMFLNAPFAIARSMPDGTILNVNPRFAELFGYASPEEFLSMKLNSPQLYANPNQRTEFWHKKELKGAIQAEVLFRQRDGREFIGNVTVQTVCDESGAIQYLESFIEDITKRKRAELDLQTERDFAMTVMNTIGQGLAVTDLSGKFIYINPAYAEFIGYTSDELLGKMPSEITYVEDLPTLRQAKNARYMGRTTTYETRLVRADGSLIDVLVTGAPRWREGRIEGTMAVITDLTEHKKMEAELRLMNDLLQNQLDDLRELQDQLQEQAVRDPLTQLYNRRYLNEILPREMARARRNHAELGLLMIDIDHFKVINDTYGHKAGDETLQAIANAIVSHLRTSDIVCRFGGEEILCLILDATEDVALRRAEQLRLAISHLPIIVSHPDVRVTVSIGGALFTENTSDINSVLHAADRALYQAKESGRNCVRLAQG